MSLRNPEGLRRWMTAYAAATATTASYERIRDAATGGHGDKPSRSATAPYIDALERMHVLEPLTAWAPTPNRLAKLATGPKHHLVDPALAVALLGLDADGLQQGKEPASTASGQRPLLGRLFESLVALSLRVLAQRSRATVHHLRRRSGDREIDFIVRARDGRVVAIEAKLSATVSDDDVRHLHWFRRTLGPGVAEAAVVTTGPIAYRRRDGIAVIPAALLGP
ncbi:ATP-binding protein [Candidatus Poriferisodalis sp.]|uniref:ATP-binding protein n=1 Tax=Candidatus Poriferisodalis sp. TaxID=3101277 RepID=UPI003B593E23